MKTRTLFVFATAALLLASCGGSGSSSQASGSSSSSSSGRSSTSQRTSSSSSSSRSSSSQAPLPTEASLPDLQPLTGTNITCIDNLIEGGEGAAKGNPGNFYVWAGDGGRKDNLYWDKGDIVLEYATGWAWYGVQVFYEAPYAKAGDNYHIRMAIHSDTDGRITFNGEVFDVVWGWNVLEKDVTVGGGTSISIQLGVSDGEVMLGGVMRFKVPEVYDATNTYYLTKFKVGEEEVKSIQVRSGEKVTPPSVTVPEGKLLSGWFDGETKLDPAAPVTEARTYTVVFVDKSAVVTHTVTYKLGDRTIYSEDVIDGEATAFDMNKTPFGYEILGTYTDAALTQAYAGAITADTTLYLKGNVKPTTWIDGGVLGPEISHGENGEFVLTFPEHTYTVSWHIQVNFEPLPVGVYGQNISFSLEYRLRGSNAGNYKAYGGGNTLADSEAALEPAASWTKIGYSYEGEMIPGDTKFTMELGEVHPVDGEEAFVLEVRNPLVVVA